MKLTEYHQKILSALDVEAAFTTGDVAKRITPQIGHSSRTHTGAVRSWLLELEHAGLVKRLDDQKPTCWLKAQND